jgi:hypothetical protein
VRAYDIVCVRFRRRFGRRFGRRVLTAV